MTSKIRKQTAAGIVGGSIFIGAIVGAIVAGCGGGGGGGSVISRPPPGPSPTPALTTGLDVATSGTNPQNAVYGPVARGSVVFSCGCSVQAGFGTTDASGNIVLVASSTPTPAVPNPTYTMVPGRNYIEVGTAASGAEAWNIQFAGRTPATNGSLEPSSRSDAYTAAAALYVYANSPTGSVAFDQWNFKTIASWVTTLKTSPNAAETTLLDDIVTQTVANQTLYPSAPTWNAGQATNATIDHDVQAVTSSADITKPTPCPSGCTNTPIP